MPNFVHGSCEDFCPEKETKLRIKEKLLHFYELRNGQKNVPGILVKSFSRSAAGTKASRTNDLRTEGCLQRTVEYLLKDIILDKRKPYKFIYDFIFDRMRSVRQEIVMQNYDACQTIRLLEPMVMFLAYSRYRLCEEAIDDFDPKICDQHLQECLKRVLCCYDEDKRNELNIKELRARIFVESLYQIFNLGSTDALKRFTSIPADIRTHDEFMPVFSISMGYYQGNLYRVLCGIKSLPHILCAIAALKMPILRRKLYETFSAAYSSKQLTVPAEFLCRLTSHQNVHDLFADCKYYNLNVTEQRNIQFNRTDFKAALPELKEKHEYFVEVKLKRIYLPEVLLLKKL